MVQCSTKAGSITHTGPCGCWSRSNCWHLSRDMQTQTLKETSLSGNREKCNANLELSYSLSTGIEDLFLFLTAQRYPHLPRVCISGCWVLGSARCLPLGISSCPRISVYYLHDLLRLPFSLINAIVARLVVPLVLLVVLLEWSRHEDAPIQAEEALLLLLIRGRFFQIAGSTCLLESLLNAFHDRVAAERPSRDWS